MWFRNLRGPICDFCVIHKKYLDSLGKPDLYVTPRIECKTGDKVCCDDFSISSNQVIVVHLVE